MSHKGMLRRPRTLEMVAAALFVVAFSLPLQVMFLYGHPPREWSQVLHKLTSLNVLVMVGCVVTALLVLQASVFTRLAAPALGLVVAVNNFFVGYLATDFSFWTASLGTLAFAAVLAPLYRGEMRELLLHPERRWWRSKRRVRVSRPIFLGHKDTVKINGATHDISESGVFLPFEVTNLGLNSVVSICLTLGELQQIRCEARVVRRSAARGSYPAGVGIQFTNLDRRQRRELKRYLTETTLRPQTF